MRISTWLHVLLAVVAVVATGLPMATPSSALAQTAAVKVTYPYVYVKAPAGAVASQLQSSDAALQAQLNSAVREVASSLPKTERGAELAVFLVDEQGHPIFPRPSTAGQHPSLGASAEAALAGNDLSFTFVSAARPWTPADLARVQAAIRDFYPVLKLIYGDPAFTLTIDVQQDPTIGVAGFYDSFSHRIVLRSVANLDSLSFLTLLAMHDQFMMGLQAWEVGMARAAEVEMFDRLPAYDYFDRNHSYTYDVFYDALNTPTIGGLNGNFFWGYIGVLIRYQLAGYAFGKILIEDPAFLSNFNAQYYAQMAVNPSIASSETALLSIASHLKPTVEQQAFSSWHANQQVLNLHPPVGTFLYSRSNQLTVDLFTRFANGSEAMRPNTPIAWSLRAADEGALDSGSSITSPNGFISVPEPSMYSGRAQLLTRAVVEGLPVSGVDFTVLGSRVGVFGIILGPSVGSITIESLDPGAFSQTTDVINGAFSMPAFRDRRGRFRATLTAGGKTLSRAFTKDASDYYLSFDARRLGPTDISVTIAASRTSVGSGDQVDFTTGVTNNGSTDATDVTLTETLPAGATLVGFGGACTQNVRVLTCNLGDLQAGATVPVRVATTLMNPGVNLVQASVSSSSSDPNLPNNSASVAVQVTGSMHTITFDDLAANQLLIGTYRDIDWGTGKWLVAPPGAAFATNSLVFSAVRSYWGTLTFSKPTRVVSLDAFNTGGPSTDLLLQCDGQPDQRLRLPGGRVTSVVTNWTSACRTMRVFSSTGGVTYFDNWVLEDESGSPN